MLAGFVGVVWRGECFEEIVARDWLENWVTS